MNNVIFEVAYNKGDPNHQPTIRFLFGAAIVSALDTYNYSVDEDMEITSKEDDERLLNSFKFKSDMCVFDDLAVIDRFQEIIEATICNEWPDLEVNVIADYESLEAAALGRSIELVYGDIENHPALS